MFGETFKNFTINFNALNPRASFSSGDVLSGQIQFELTKDTKVHSITLCLEGGAKVSWTTRRRGRKGRTRTQVHSARLEFFKFKHALLQENNATGPSRLPVGVHVYPFSVQIPHGDFPPSFKGVNGRVLYTLMVEIHRPWHMAKHFETEVKFENHTNFNRPELLVSYTLLCWIVSGASLHSLHLGPCLRFLLPEVFTKHFTTWGHLLDVVLDLCCFILDSGSDAHQSSASFIPLSVQSQDPRFGVKSSMHCKELSCLDVREMLKIIMQIDNASSRTVTPKACLIQKQSFYTLNKRQRRCVPRQLVQTYGQAVNPYTTDVYCEMMLQIPDDAPQTITNCQILEVEYSVMVSLSISGGASNLETLFFIVLCSAPVYQPAANQPQVYPPQVSPPQVFQPPTSFPTYPPPAYQSVMKGT
ncbi:arrestin domain-containing protein 3-like [Chanos chanos]|uniref:Arrestin domain-containing protein 3-like n=1 Tax=Chanos chanos TaxID=29144 RepID=A0A6J2WTV8_CHACN|nr:arrestin domain-containing protein 3-like [Chanos chanos]